MTVLSTLDSVLSAVSTALAADGRPVDRVVHFYGVPAWDCEMLAAWPRMKLVSGVDQATGRTQRGITVLSLEVNLLLLRCVTVFEGKDIPSAATVNADGANYAADMEAMYRSLVDGVNDGTLFSDCTVVRLNSIDPQPPQQFSAMTTMIEVTL